MSEGIGVSESIDLGVRRGRLEGLMLKPVVTVDGKILFKEGRLKEK